MGLFTRIARKGAQQQGEAEVGHEGQGEATGTVEAPADDRRRRQERREERRRKREARALERGLRGARKRGGGEARKDDGAGSVTVTLSKNATQDAIPIRRIWPDGVCLLDDGSWSCCLLFDDVAWMSVREEEKEDTGALWGEFLDSLSPETTLQVCLVSKAIDHRSFLSELALRPREGDDLGNPLREEFNAYVSSKLAASAKSMRRTRGIVVRTQAKDHDEAAQKLGLVQIRAGQLFDNLDSDCRVLDGQSWIDLVREVTRPDSATGKVDAAALADAMPLLTTRDLVAPERIERLESGDLVVGGRYVRTYAVTKFSRYVRDSFLSNLTQLPVDLMVSMHVRPWEHARSVALAQHHVYEVGSENNAYKLSASKPERGYFVDDENLPPSMRDDMAEAERFRDKIVNEGQHLYSVCLLVSVMARGEEELESSCKQVESVFSEQLIEEVDHWHCLQEQMWSSCLPLGRRMVPDSYEASMLTEALEVYAPFSSVEVMDEGGMLMGINSDTNNFISYDQSLREDTNVFVLGQPGKGKSVWSKLTTLQKWLRDPDADIIVVDPEAENVGLVRSVGGTIVDLSETSRSHINLMEMSTFYGATDPTTPGNPLPRKVDFLQSAIQLMASSVTDAEKSVIDAAAAYVYGPYLDSRDPEDLPTLQDFYDYLMTVSGESAPDARHLATLISRFVTGTFSVFNHKTTVDLKARVVDFVITDLNDDLKPLAMMVLMDYVWTKVTENRRSGRRTYLLVDETQLLLEVPIVCRWLDRFFSRGRKWDFYITCVTQNVQRLLNIEEASYMFENTPLLVLTGQAKRAAALLAQILGLSVAQRRTLEHAQPGEGLYIFRHKVIHYDFRIDRRVCPRIYDLITTRPDDRKAIKGRRRKRARTGAEDAIEAAAGTTPEASGHEGLATAVEGAAETTDAPVAGAGGADDAPAEPMPETGAADVSEPKRGDKAEGEEGSGADEGNATESCGADEDDADAKEAPSPIAAEAAGQEAAPLDEPLPGLTPERQRALAALAQSALDEDQLAEVLGEGMELTYVLIARALRTPEPGSKRG